MVMVFVWCVGGDGDGVVMMMVMVMVFVWYLLGERSF